MREDNPRKEGIEKRKVYFETEHERDCKRLRPEFEPEDELRKLTENWRPTTVQRSNPSKLFEIFTKSKKPLFPQQKCKKSKTKSTPSNKKKSLTTVAAKPGPDIRNYLKQNQSCEKPAVVQQLSKLGKEKELLAKCNYGVRDGESGVNWDPGL